MACPRRMRVVVIAASLLLGLAVEAAAHVVVVPARSEAGNWERYTVLVPTESASPTVRVVVKLPTGVDVIALESKPGWEGRYQPFPIGAATVEWKGGRIPPGEFVSFEFLAWNPPAARVLTWEATQWYEDGTSERWNVGADPKLDSTTTLGPKKEDGARGMPRHDAVPGTPPPAK